jgi:hypothetical protein
MLAPPTVHLLAHATGAWSAERDACNRLLVNSLRWTFAERAARGARAYEVREAVDRDGELDQRGGSALVYALHPGSNRLGTDEKGLRCLFERPTTSSLEFQYRKRGTIVGAMVGRNAGHAGILNAQLLPKQDILFLMPLSISS